MEGSRESRNERKETLIVLLLSLCERYRLISQEYDLEDYSEKELY